MSQIEVLIVNACMEVVDHLQAQNGVHDLDDTDAHEEVLILKEVLVSVPKDLLEWISLISSTSPLDGFLHDLAIENEEDNTKDLGVQHQDLEEPVDLYISESRVIELG